jgi:hypothetical protein
MNKARGFSSGFFFAIKSRMLKPSQKRLAPQPFSDYPTADDY